MFLDSFRVPIRIRCILAHGQDRLQAKRIEPLRGSTNGRLLGEIHTRFVAPADPALAI